MGTIWRILLPGFAFQAVVIGGGYATGRELVAFFMPSGPIGGLVAMCISALIWSLTMMLVLEISRRFSLHDYKSLMEKLIGPGWILFEIAYIALLITVLSIVGAAAGEIAREMLGVPTIAGTSALIILSTLVLLYGSTMVRRALSYWSVVMYLAYSAFVTIFLVRQTGIIAQVLADTHPVGMDVLVAGVRYAGVNVNVFASILFLVPLLRSKREAYVAGALVGPLAMTPGILFYFLMAGYYPQIQNEAVPLNFLLRELGIPMFALIFQIVIFGTLLQTGIGMLHSLNERIDQVYEARGHHMPGWLRATLAFAMMLFSITVAEWLGLVALIDKGYGFLSWIFVILIFLPVFTIGIRLLLGPGAQAPTMAMAASEAPQQGP